MKKEKQDSWLATRPGVSLEVRPSNSGKGFTLEVKVDLPAGAAHVPSGQSNETTNRQEWTIFGALADCTFASHEDYKRLCNVLTDAALLIEERSELAAFVFRRRFELKSSPDFPKGWDRKGT